MKRLLPVLLLLLPAGAPPEEFLAVPEWYGSVVITHEADAQEAGVTDQLPWQRSRKVDVRFAFDFHLNKTHAGGFIPSSTPPPMSELAEGAKTRRTWTGTPDKASGLKTPATLVLDDRSEEEGDTPVEGRVVDRQGTSNTQSVRTQVQMMLLIPQLIVDAKKKVYHLILGNMPMNLTGPTTPERYVQWTRFWHGGTQELVQTVNRSATGLYPQFSALKIDATKHLDQPLPGSAARIEGSVSYDVPLPQFKNGAKGKVTIRWLLTPKPPEPVELLIEKPIGYDEWRPKAGLHEDAAGAHVPIRIRLQKKGGGEPIDRAQSITCRLINVSREPGVCLNWPQTPKSTPDLRFEAGMNTGWKDEATVERKDGGLTRIMVVASSYDWGAFGELQARAILDSGREILAEVEGDPGRTTLRFPKSAEGSRIADSWRQKHDQQNVADEADKDELPKGDGTPGDGLSLYEEYRGFVQEGYRLATSPKTKNFFVFDKIGGDSKGGIRIFKDATGLDVHHKLRESETGKNRVINGNTSGYAHRVHQHLVILDSYAETRFSKAEGGPGVPKEIVSVFMSPHPLVQQPNLAEGLREQASAYWQRALAHELLHCCNVYHHGDRDTEEVWERAQDRDGTWKFWKASVGTTGTVTRIGAPIRLFVEPNTPAVLTPSPDLKTVQVGEKQGQHSGPEVCLMRYDVADVYRKSATEYFWISGEEPTGESLCTQREGSTYNKVPRVAGANFPMSRHGQADTSQDRGRCLFQIRVTDEGAPRRRGR